MSIVAKRLNGSRWHLAWSLEVGVDGDTASFPKKGANPPIFGPFLLWRNGWMHQNATSDILVIKIILVLVLVSFQSNHFYFI